MVKKIIRYPDPSLRKQTKDVTFPLTDELLEHIRDLKDTLAATSNGVALASNQILADGHRVFVVKEGLDADLPKVVINPSWKPYEKTQFEFVHEEEGCLSIPHFGARLKRYVGVVLEYQAEDGTFDHLIPQVLLGARIVQHECDHLAGKVIIDHLDKSSQIKAYNDILRRRKRGQ
jgi:peptide deformylase